MISGVIRTLAPTILSAGIATESDMELTTLHDRLSDAILAADAVVLPPDVVVAWGTSGG